jgi:hypothetical protein
MQLARAIDDTFCILVLGDFLGGGPVPSGMGAADWSPHRATPDTVLKLVGLRPRIRVSLEGEEGLEEEAGFSSLQELDPGDLFKRLSLFEPFREAREAAKGGSPGSGAPPGEGGDVPPLPNGGGGSLLDAILDVAEPAGESPPLRTPEELNAFVRKVVRPHLVSDESDARSRVAAVDETASLHLSKLLHDESFQRLEAIWRSLVFLLSRTDTTGKVRVYLVHLPRETLENDLESSDDPRESRLFDLLSGHDLRRQGKRWAVVVGAFGFGFGARDIRLLERIARVARAADLPWISGAEPWRDASDPALGPDGVEKPMDDPPEEWARLRERPEAAWIGLTYPRFLLREPFTEGRRRGNELDFRETVTSWGELLWGHGPFLVASLMAQGFAADGWGFPPERYLEEGGMPLAAPGHETGSQPRSVSIPLTPGDARRVGEMGLMPLVGFPGRAGVRIGGFHSVSVRGVTPAAWWRG